jgi:hypothetical protein
MESALYIVPVLVVVVFLSTAIKVLREYERAVMGEGDDGRGEAGGPAAGHATGDVEASRGRA